MIYCNISFTRFPDLIKILTKLQCTGLTFNITYTPL